MTSIKTVPALTFLDCYKTIYVLTLEQPVESMMDFLWFSFKFEVEGLNVIRELEK